MKVLASLFTVVMSLAVVNAAATPELEKRCLANGSRCVSNGALGNCCSGFCLQQQGVSAILFKGGGDLVKVTNR